MRVLVIFILSALCLSANAQNLKIGFIDTEQVVTSLTKYTKSLEIISNEFEPKKHDLLALHNHIELLRASIESKNSSQDPSNLELSNLKELEGSFEQETEFWQRSINTKKVNLLKEIEKLVNISIKEFALENDYDLILYKDVAFVSNKINITLQIIEKIENRSP